MDYGKSLQLLIKNELKPLGIHNKRIIKAFQKIPRHYFVLHQYKKEAYFDYPLPIGHNQFTSQPSLIASIIQSLDLNKNDKVLEIGTGCGYFTALLAVIVEKVYTIELINSLLTGAIKNFTRLELKNIFCKFGNGFRGWSDFAPYDGIIISAATSNIPFSLVKQLKENGKIIIPLGEEESNQILTLGTKKNHKLVLKQLQEVRFVPLISDKKQFSHHAKFNQDFLIGD